MKQNTISEYTRQIFSALSDRWSAHHANRIARAKQAAASQTPGQAGKRTTDQRAALNTWEGEGGSTVAPAKAVPVQQERTDREI